MNIFDDYLKARKHIKEDCGAASVHVHGFTTLPDGSEEYTDDPDLIDGWCTMVRIETPDDVQQPFDILLSMKAPTKERAIIQARWLADDLLFNPDSWSEY